MLLEGKKILLGITGSIAAYKAAYLTRLLVKEGAEVKIILTPYAKEFITPVTLATLSNNTVLIDFFKHDDGAWNSHVELGLWADVFLIAPCTANTIAKMAHGVCDNLLLTTYLSVRCKVILAPAMDYDMFRHPSTVKNIEILKSYGNFIIEPAEGELASGLIGKGRMEEPERIVEQLSLFFTSQNDFHSKKVLITAGPTYEAIDPVRFIGNHSSGKMGFALGQELAERGASVILIAGPVAESIQHPNIKRINVVSAEEMYAEVMQYIENVDAAIFAAAVADFTPKEVKQQKQKSNEASLNIELKPTKDIAQAVGKIKKHNQIVVGFALETNDEEVNAKAKIEKKNFDFIVLNSLNDLGAGFRHDTNLITIIHKSGETKKYTLKSKKDVAKDIIDNLANLFKINNK